MRNKEMVGLFRDGLTLEAIADKYEISKERVRQLLNREMGKSDYKKQSKDNHKTRPRLYREYIRKCKRCGVEMNIRERFDNPSKREYCVDCKKKITIEKRTVKAICAYCGNPFTYVSWGGRARKSCSHSCHLKRIHQLRTKNKSNG